MEIVCAPHDLLYRGISSISFPSGTRSLRSRAQKLRELADRAEIALPWCRPKMLLWIPFFTCHSGAKRRDQATGNETVPRPSAKKTPDSGCTEGGHVKSVLLMSSRRISFLPRQNDSEEHKGLDSRQSLLRSTQKISANI